jgi:hypothetical protein
MGLVRFGRYIFLGLSQENTRNRWETVFKFGYSQMGNKDVKKIVLVEDRIHWQGLVLNL